MTNLVQKVSISPELRPSAQQFVVLTGAKRSGEIRGLLCSLIYIARCGWRGHQIARGRLTPTKPVDILKIEKSSSQGRTTIRLIGRFQSDHIEELKIQLQTNGALLVLDLQEVTLVDLDVVRFLGYCETAGVKIIHCPPYIREWMIRERQG
jgi:hypothetical protein